MDSVPTEDLAKKALCKHLNVLPECRHMNILPEQCRLVREPVHIKAEGRVQFPLIAESTNSDTYWAKVYLGQDSRYTVEITQIWREEKDKLEFRSRVWNGDMSNWDNE